MSRLKQWLDEETQGFEHHYGPLDDSKRAEYREALEDTLIGKQLKAADALDGLWSEIKNALPTWIWRRQRGQHPPQ